MPNFRSLSCICLPIVYLHPDMSIILESTSKQDLIVTANSYDAYSRWKLYLKLCVSPTWQNDIKAGSAELLIAAQSCKQIARSKQTNQMHVREARHSGSTMHKRCRTNHVNPVCCSLFFRRGRRDVLHLCTHLDCACKCAYCSQCLSSGLQLCFHTACDHAAR